jgi:hypothetical protein
MPIDDGQEEPEGQALEWAQESAFRTMDALLYGVRHWTTTLMVQTKSIAIDAEL